METLWIARDKNSDLYIYNKKPIRNEKSNTFMTNHNLDDEDNILFYDEVEITPKLFPEVTWENSPQQVELKLIKNGK